MKVVFVSGVWDLFHVGHLRRLERAKGLGDCLVVGVCTDEFAETYKDKPVVSFQDRREIVVSLKYVDATYPHRSADDVRSMEFYRDMGCEVIRVVGTEFGKLEGQGRFLEWAKENDVEVVVMSRTPNISTTKIKEAVREGKTIPGSVYSGSGVSGGSVGVG